MNFKRFDSSEGNVWKYVFDFEDAIAESVLYKYESFEKRTVICCSVQSGCPVGCVFCGTGKQFIRNLSADEICSQISEVIKDSGIKNTEGIKKFQIMFMSMGEPFLNFANVCTAITILNNKYPNAQLLVSTMGINSEEKWEEFVELSRNIEEVGLQFSLHSGLDHIRDKIIPFKNKLGIRRIRDMGYLWNSFTGRPVYLNYCVTEKNLGSKEVDRIKDLFPTYIFNITFSVLCSADENMTRAGEKNIRRILDATEYFRHDGYNVRIFDPAGQDDIGGGCGQLWYTQKWMKERLK